MIIKHRADYSDNMELQIVDFSNYEVAIKVQNEIFPYENGVLNILASLDRDLFIKTTGLFYPDDSIKYYLVYNAEKIIGITGIYCKKELSPTDAWLGWFGVLPAFRESGFGEKILLMTLELAKSQGYKVMRLYTDDEESIKATNLYKKVGFVGEKYLAEKLTYNCYIFSRSLSSKPIEFWQNKKLDLAYQSQLDQMNNDQIKEIISLYQKILNHVAKS